MRAAERAAGLTQQLLAFARQQPLQPKAEDINRLLSCWTELIRRTLPASVSIRRIEHPAAGTAEVDRNQLESALLNLAVNARDAMPDGGTLTIETDRLHVRQQDVQVPFDLPPGHYVFISISDTGVGMTPEILTRAFEPFFTTKPLGQGTGLGLSQVFGFVKQSGSILLVEDNDCVRAFSGDAPRDCGFTVVEAADAAEALRILDTAAPVDLLTDIGLPGVDGRELVAIVRPKRPHMRILFTSGYAQMPAAASSRWDSDIPLLSKPFTRGQLYEKVLQILAAP